MYRGQRNVQRILHSLLRKGVGLNEFASQGYSLVRDPQPCYASKHFEPLLCRLGVASSGLVRHQLRHVDIKVLPPMFPPLARHFLVRRQNQVPTRPGRQVTDDGRLQIDPLFHAHSSPARYVLEAPLPANLATGFGKGYFTGGRLA